jgi:hypothetical protein
VSPKTGIRISKTYEAIFSMKDKHKKMHAWGRYDKTIETFKTLSSTIQGRQWIEKNSPFFQ